MSSESKHTTTQPQQSPAGGKVLLRALMDKTGQLLEHAVNRSDFAQSPACECRCTNAGVCPSFTYLISPVTIDQLNKLADMLKKSAPEGHSPCHFTWGYGKGNEGQYETFAIYVTFARDASTEESAALWKQLVHKPTPRRAMTMGQAINDLLGKHLPSWNA